MSNLALSGPSAFFPFQKKQLIRKLKKIDPNCLDLEANWHYWIGLKVPLSDIRRRHLEELLEGTLPKEDSSGGLKQKFWLVPRAGTQSPWSSKTTELVQSCGFEEIVLVERYIAIELVFAERVEQDKNKLSDLLAVLVDPMMQEVLDQASALNNHFESIKQPGKLAFIPFLAKGKAALELANKELGLALDLEELNYLSELYTELKRDPTDAELMMFAQANSEHCRHKIFNAKWMIDGQAQEHSLFGMIKNTYKKNPEGVLSAYKDNAAVFANAEAKVLVPVLKSGLYEWQAQSLGTLIKVETHNHPTAISPFPGAATGTGGELRDEGATGRGSKPKAGLVGFSVSDLCLENFPQPWEVAIGRPAHIASALDIMIQAPLGSASYGNEFGRPTLCGYFRSFTQVLSDTEIRGYHKPIMIAGGMGSIWQDLVTKKELPDGALLIIVGGPAMLIGLGGGAASSVSQGSGNSSLDFASVQRDNPEMQRRCQELIDRCAQLGADNPILSIHDVGAGGLSNALAELVHDSEKGAVLDLRAIPSADPSLSPMAIWANESQERYVLGILEADLTRFTAMAVRERAPFAVVGRIQAGHILKLEDRKNNQAVIDLSLEKVIANLPKKQLSVKSTVREVLPFEHSLSLEESIKRLLSLPTIGDKSFLITIGDRSVGGLVARDQMVGPWQVPVADCAVTTLDYTGYKGEAMAMGERAPVAVLDPVASVQLAVGEALTNLMASDLEQLSDIRLSCNWMAATGSDQDKLDLYKAVEEVGLNLCPALDLCVPVGKDSLSMNSVWSEAGKDISVRAPLSLVVSAFAPVTDVRKTLTPLLSPNLNTSLILVDLGAGQARLGGSAYAQVSKQLGGFPPRIDEPELLRAAFNLIKNLKAQDLLLAYHDRSDGGLLITLLEMAFASHCGLEIDLSKFTEVQETLFNEELGFVVQIENSNWDIVAAELDKAGLAAHAYKIARPIAAQDISILQAGECVYREKRTVLQQLWSRTSYEMQKLRDEPACVEEAYAAILDETDPGLSADLSFDWGMPLLISARGEARPRVGILREQGVNGQQEMAAAFSLAGFDAVDLCMNDLRSEPGILKTLSGLAACGGFSYGDVLGAGTGWAKAILFNKQLEQAFGDFFARPDSFTLGVCNGCQLLSQLTPIIPGSANWPKILPNLSGRFEARLSMVQITESPSILFDGMSGSKLPVVVAHGEGRMLLGTKAPLVCLQYIDNHGHLSQAYPSNPNGSPQGITGFCNQDGRVTALMPHPERLFRTVQFSWHPKNWQTETSPWMQLFINARKWVKG